MQNVIMRFKLHLVKEIYPDLRQYYDPRELLAEITVNEPRTIEYFWFSQHLTKHFGYRGDALLYYLKPGER